MVWIRFFKDTVENKAHGLIRGFYQLICEIPDDTENVIFKDACWLNEGDVYVLNDGTVIQNEELIENFTRKELLFRVSKNGFYEWNGTMYAPLKDKIRCYRPLFDESRC